MSKNKLHDVEFDSAKLELQLRYARIDDGFRCSVCEGHLCGCTAPAVPAVPWPHVAQAVLELQARV
jgi:hypothetical protein